MTNGVQWNDDVSVWEIRRVALQMAVETISPSDFSTSYIINRAEHFNTYLLSGRNEA